MKASLVLFALTGLLTTTTYASQVLSGLDQNNQPCQLKIDSLNVGPTTMHDACEFDSDGRGPWCDHAPKVAKNKVTGSGVYVTAAGTETFSVDDQYAEMTGTERNFVGQIAEGNYLNVKTDNDTLTAYATFLSSYGKTLTGQQIRDSLSHIPQNSTYQVEYSKIYTDETCTIQK